MSAPREPSEQAVVAAFYAIYGRKGGRPTDARDGPELVAVSKGLVAAYAIDAVGAALEAGPQGDTQRQEWERTAWKAGAASQFALSKKAIERLEAEIVALKSCGEAGPSPDLLRRAIEALEGHTGTHTISCACYDCQTVETLRAGVRGESLPPLPGRRPE